MKIILRTVLVIALLIIGFAAGVPVGKSIGFTTGSEWALVQADLLAREAGMFMPVRFEEGMFRIKLKQPSHLHKRAWKIADWHFEQMAKREKCEIPLSEHVVVARNAYLTQ
jgi:hypothetical protein